MQITSLVISAAAIVVAVLAYLGSRSSASRANAAAERSAEAATRSASAAERHAEVVVAEATKYRVPWQLEHITASTLRLINQSDEDAHMVHVVRPNAAEGVRLFGEPQGATIAARASVKFACSIGIGVTDQRIRVVWRRPNDEEHVWDDTL